MFPGPEVLPVLDVHPDMSGGRQLHPPAPRLQVRVRAGQAGLSARHAEVRVRVAQEDVLLQAAGSGRGRALHGSPGPGADPGVWPGVAVSVRSRSRVPASADIVTRMRPPPGPVEAGGPAVQHQRDLGRPRQLRRSLSLAILHLGGQTVHRAVAVHLVHPLLPVHGHHLHHVPDGPGQVPLPGETDHVPVPLLPDGQCGIPGPCHRGSRHCGLSDPVLHPRGEGGDAGLRGLGVQQRPLHLRVRPRLLLLHVLQRLVGHPHLHLVPLCRTQVGN